MLTIVFLSGFPRAWIQGSLECGSGHWYEQSPRRRPLDLVQSELLKLRGDAEVPLPLLPFPPFSCIHNPVAAWQRLQFKGSQTLREGSLLFSGWSCDPKRVGWTQLRFFFSLQSSTTWPSGQQSRATEATAFRPKDQRRELRGPEITGKSQRGMRSESEFMKFCELPGSPYAHMALISKGHTKGLEKGLILELCRQITSWYAGHGEDRPD